METFDEIDVTHEPTYSISQYSLIPSWTMSRVPTRPWNSETGMNLMTERTILAIPSWNSRFESAPLTEQELADIHFGIEEIRSGTAMHFADLSETLEWLNRKRTK